MAKRITKKKNDSEIKRVAIYMRVSTEDQAKDGWGLPVQLTQCTAMATVKGWSVDPDLIFADEGISGTKDETERPQLKRMLDAADAGLIDIVIVKALDRLGRETMIVLSLINKLSNAGCELISCNESLDTSTPTGMFVVQMFAALAQLDHSNIVKRLKDGRNARFKKDGERGGRLPFGYIRTIDGIEVDYRAADVVRDIFIWHRQGETLRTIAERASGATGRRWHASTIRVILDNRETYQGKRRVSGADWPVILS
jgi:site-specific DNA recombinase